MAIVLLPAWITTTIIVNWLHMLSTFVWLSGIFYNIFAFLSNRNIQELARRLAIALQFIPFIWISLVLLGLTGIYNTFAGSVGTPPAHTLVQLASLRNSSPYWTALYVKHFFVLGSIALWGIISFYILPRLHSAVSTLSEKAGAERTLPTTPFPTDLMRLFQVLSCINLLLAAGILYAVSLMIYTLH